MHEGLTKTGCTENSQSAAEKIAEDVIGFQKEVKNVGVYEAIVEGGFHDVSLNDKEEQFLIQLVIEEGTNRLKRFADDNHPEYTDLL